MGILILAVKKTGTGWKGVVWGLECSDSLYSFSFFLSQFVSSCLPQLRGALKLSDVVSGFCFLTSLVLVL